MSAVYGRNVTKRGISESFQVSVKMDQALCGNKSSCQSIGTCYERRFRVQNKFRSKRAILAYEVRMILTRKCLVPVLVFPNSRERNIFTVTQAIICELKFFEMCD